jgi:hypothetical protein
MVGLSSRSSTPACSGGRVTEMAVSVERATMRLAMPPMTASRTDSVRSWPKSRRRLAPRDPRMAISRARLEPRASNRLAMSAQAISRTNPVIAKRSVRGV